jgi:diguanylate cyclase (GGDEF)-like protein/PAS domain S-box-containing protein
MNITYSIALFISAVISVFLMVIAWRRRSAAGAIGLAAVMAAMFIWSFTYAVRWSVNSVQLQFFWLDLSFIGVVLAPGALLVFVLQYINRSDLVTRRNLVILAIEPILTMILLWTDPLHGLFFAGHHSTGAILSGGPGFWVNAIYSYAVIAAAIVFLFVHMRNLPAHFRKGVWVIIVGMLVPVFCSMLELFIVSPFPGLDITPFFFTISGIFIAVGLFRFHMLDLTPVALNKLIETTVDGMVVLDSKKVVVNFNPAAKRIFPHGIDKLGASAISLFSRWPELLLTISSGKESSLEIQVENGRPRTFEVTISTLHQHRNAINGWLLVFHDITAYKQTETALIESENKLRSLFKSMTDVILILDKNGRYLEIAPTNPSNLARDPFNLLGKTVFDIFPVEQAELFIKTIHQSLNTQNMVRVDYSMDIDNRKVWFAGNVSPLTDESVTWVARDITERKVWEEELSNSENKLRSLFSAMTDVIFVFDLDGRYLEFAPTSTTRLPGIREEIIGKTVYELLPHETATLIHQTIQQTLSTGTVAYANYNLQIANQNCWFSASSSPLSTETVIWVEHDISELVLSTEALKEKENQYVELLNNLSEGIAIVDLNEVFIYANPKANEFFGLTNNQLIDRNIEDFVTREVYKFLKEQTEERKAGKSNVYDLEIIREDGASRTLQVSTRPQLDPKGIIIGTFAVFREVTESRLAQQALRESETRLKLAQQIAHIGNFELDVKTRRFWASEETFNIFGLEYSSPYFTFKRVYDLVLPEDQPKFSRIIGDLLTRDTTYDEEFQVIRSKENEPRILHGIAQKIINEKGEVIKLSGVVQDITVLKRTEKALEKRMLALTRPLEGSENITFDDLFNLDDIQRLQDEFAQATGVASVITTPDGKPITQPSNFCRLCKDIIRETETGRFNCFKSDATIGSFNPEGPNIQPCLSGGLWDAGAGISVGGQHIANWLIGQVRDETQTEEKMREYARQIGAEEQEVVDAFKEVPSMSKKQFEEVAQALFTLANQLSKAAYQNIQQARFISERKQAEEALQLSENKLRTLFNAMSDVIIIYGRDGRYLEIASTNSGKLYRPPNDLLNKLISEVFPPDLSNFFMKIIAQTLDSNEMIQVDYQLPINGMNYWFAANVSPLTKDSVIWVARDITDRKKVEDTLQYQSNHDILTGLYNRQYYETEILRLQNSRLFPISIMVLDVDDLKWMNDHRGHDAGDELLQRTAGILKSAFRPEDMVARMGGDEFVVVLPETDEQAVTLVKNRLDEILDKHNELFPLDMSLGISIGVATGGNGILLTEVFKLADQAMYLEKAIKKKSKSSPG